MKFTLFVLLASLLFFSCENSYQEKKEKRDKYITLLSVYKALNSNKETAKIQYNDSIHKYTILLNELSNN